MTEVKRQTVLYDNTKSGKKGEFHPLTLALLLAVGSGTAILFYAEWYLLTDPKRLWRVLGVVLAGGYFSYLFYFGYQYHRSRGALTRRAILTSKEMSVENGRGTKRIIMEEIIFSMSYASASNLCLLVITEEDQAVVTCSAENLFLRRGKERLGAFYAINAELMRRNPHHINYVKARNYGKRNTIRIPIFLFEVEFDTPRFRRFAAQMREERYRRGEVREAGNRQRFERVKKSG